MPDWTIRVTIAAAVVTGIAFVVARTLRKRAAAKAASKPTSSGGSNHRDVK